MHNTSPGNCSYVKTTNWLKGHASLRISVLLVDGVSWPVQCRPRESWQALLPATDQRRKRVSWIRTIPYQDADPALRQVYDRVRGPGGTIDNILMLHSLRPHTLTGHMALYKNVLHNSKNMLPMWLVETIGVYVSMLNRCQYCVEHHFAGLVRLLDDDARTTSIRQALEKHFKVDG